MLMEVSVSVCRHNDLPTIMLMLLKLVLGHSRKVLPGVHERGGLLFPHLASTPSHRDQREEKFSGSLRIEEFPVRKSGRVSSLCLCPARNLSRPTLANAISDSPTQAPTSPKSTTTAWKRVVASPLPPTTTSPPNISPRDGTHTVGPGSR